MITQIYSIHSIEEAKMCLDAGADNIGVALDTGFRCPREVDFDTCKAIFDYIGDKATKVLIIVSADEEPIFEYTPLLKPDILHICGNELEATPELVKRIKAKMPGLEVMQAVGIPSEGALEKAKYFAGFCDYIILDSIAANMTSIGVAGVTHDWNLDKQIIDAVKPCKVIMAGGLGPENVREAIRFAHPYGVDSFTKTSDKLPNGDTQKSFEKIKRFVEEAKDAIDD